MKKIIDKIKAKPKKVEPKVVIFRPKKSVDEWDKYMGAINDLLLIKKDNRSLAILMDCLRKMENRDK
jgi:hypothetical protein